MQLEEGWKNLSRRVESIVDQCDQFCRLEMGKLCYQVQSKSVLTHKLDRYVISVQ